jgi:DNA-binding transcriptional regulator GbsR (MarR family)
MSQIPDPLRRFVHDTGLLLENAGMPRIAGQVLGWLLVCEPEHQSLTALAEVLGVSKASVSTTTRLLIQFGLLERTVLSGDRRDYYRVSHDAWNKFMRTRIETMHRMSQNAERGLRLLHDAPPERRTRLVRMHRLFSFLEREMTAVFERYEDVPEEDGFGHAIEVVSPVGDEAGARAAEFARKGGEP